MSPAAYYPKDPLAFSSFPATPRTVGAAPQQKTAARQTRVLQERAPENTKVPTGKLDKPQRIGQGGETVPIVFGKKRGADGGGIWLAPPLLKTGSKDFVPSQLFAISQGKMVSSPSLANVWSGTRNQIALNLSLTLTHIYKTNAQLVATPVCPIAGDGLYCGIDTFSFLEPTIDGSAVGKKTRVRGVPRSTFYQGIRTITKGTGDTDNSTYTCTYTVFDNSSGNDVTTAYNTALGLSGSLRFNTDASGNPVQVGTIVDLVAAAGYSAPNPSAFGSIGDGSGSFTIEYTVSGLFPITNSSNPEDNPYALTGNQFEITASIYANPDTSTITDFTDYADITFLKAVGALFGTLDEGSLPENPKQMYIYYEEGVEVDLYSAGLSGGSYTTGASDQIVDLAMYLFTLLQRVDGVNTAAIASPMSTSNMQAVTAFCDNYKMRFNGVISNRVNVLEYLGSLAPCFLLSFVNLDGQFQFRPLLPVNGSNLIDTTALTPTATFTDANILPGSFSKSYIPAEDRRDFIASVAFREAEQKEIGTERTVKVRYSSNSADIPVEQFDLTDFCVIEAHAIAFARHELARRKYQTHSVTFQVSLLTTGLAPMDIIKIQRQRISSAGDNRTESEHYQVTSITHSSVGVSTIEAIHFPLNGSSVSLISSDAASSSPFTVF